MNAHALTYPALRRVADRRRGRALFLSANAQHVESSSLAREISRAVMTAAAASVWCAVVALLAS